MKRSFLSWFYLAVQFIMLAVSIPKVATLFHAYDPQVMGPTVAGIDARNWLVGIAIDLTATFTTWAAMAKYDETRKRTALLAPAFIIILCTGLSVVANYEEAATLAPVQYRSIELFTQPALYINPILISAPPVLVFLLILLVPSVLAQPRIKTALEIAAEADEQEALINAGARIKEAKARANAQVRTAQVTGLADTLNAARERVTKTATAQPEEHEPRGGIDLDRAPEAPDTAHYTRAMWQAMPLKERVLKSEIISAQEVAEVLAVSQPRARDLMKEVRTVEDEQRAVKGRTGVLYDALIESLYARRTPGSAAQAKKLEAALGLRKRTRQLSVVPDGPALEEETEESVS